MRVLRHRSWLRVLALLVAFGLHVDCALAEWLTHAGDAAHCPLQVEDHSHWTAPTPHHVHPDTLQCSSVAVPPPLTLGYPGLPAATPVVVPPLTMTVVVPAAAGLAAPSSVDLPTRPLRGPPAV